MTTPVREPAGSGSISATGVMKSIGSKTRHGAAKSVELTKRAVSSLPNPLAGVDMSRFTEAVPRVPLGTHSMTRFRRMFTGADATATTETTGILPDESSDDEEVDCSPAALDEKVDRKYFDPSFDACQAEVMALQASYSEGRADVERELASLEHAQRERNDQLKVVNAGLKKRILENYEVFVQGVVRIRDVNSDLVSAASECRHSRQRLGIARHSFVENGLAIPRQRRRRENLRRLLQLLETMDAAKKRSAELRALHASHRFKELVDITKSRELPESSSLVGVVATEAFLNEWSQFVKDPEAVLRDADDAVERCISRRFDLGAYMSAVDAYAALGARTAGVKRITTRLLAAGSTIVQRAISDLAGRVQGDVATVAANVPVEAAAMCVCQICARVLDTVLLVKRIMRCHRDVVDRDDPARSTEEIDFHKALFDATTDAASKMGDIIQFNITEAASHLRLRDDATIALHVFYLFSLAIEATSELGVGSKAMAGARERLKTVVRDWVSTKIVADRAMQLVGAMESDLWAVDSSVSADQFSIVGNLSPATFRRDVKRVKAYIADPAPGVDNPFFDASLALPQDASDMAVSKFTPLGQFRDVVPSAALVSNAGFVLACRVVARFPPLATEIADWLLQLSSLYLYIAAANFISVSRLTPLEEQHDFSAGTREQFRQMRQACLTVVPELADGEGSFPPAVYDQIRERFGSESHHFALVERMSAMVSGVTVVDFCAATVKSVAPLLAKSVADAHAERFDRLRAAAVEMLHVGTHRLANAVFPVDWLADELTRTKWTARDGMQAGSYVAKLTAKLDSLQNSVARRLKFPSKFLEDVFWMHVAYAVQRAMISGFAAVKKKNDAAVSQMNVDALALQEALKESLGRHAATGGEKQVSLFLRAYFGSADERRRWVKEHHTLFRRDDVVSWLAEDRDTKSTLDSLLREIGHDDHVFIENFVARER